MRVLCVVSWQRRQLTAGSDAAWRALTWQEHTRASPRSMRALAAPHAHAAARTHALRLHRSAAPHALCRAAPGSPRDGGAFDLGSPVRLREDGGAEAEPVSRAESIAAAMAALRTAQSTQPPGLARAVLEYGALCDTALSLGIPRRALPQPEQPQTCAGVQRCAAQLGGIIASFTSSGL